MEATPHSIYALLTPVPEADHSRIAYFGERFDVAHLHLACHAAVPLVLTPDLLYCIWSRFKFHLNVPWVAVSDLLLSSLCQEVGSEFYQMPSAVRRRLLQALKEDYGQERIKELAKFLEDYLKEQPESDYVHIRQLTEAQRWAALAYRDASQSAEELRELFDENGRNQNLAGQLRCASIIEAIADPLRDGGKHDVVSFFDNWKRHRQAATGAAHSAAAGPLRSGGRDTTDRKREAHYRDMAYRLGEGRVVLVLGPEINLVGRSPRQAWWPDAPFPPTDKELADYLAERYSLPPDEPRSLGNVAQYVTDREGDAALDADLEAVFNRTFDLNAAHRFFAQLPATLRAKRARRPYPLILTTAMDDLLERAFTESGEPFDVVTYNASPSYRGEFWHKPYKEWASPIRRPRAFLGLPLGRRTVIWRLRGGPRRESQHWSNLLTNEQSIAQAMMERLPLQISTELFDKPHCFLGCSPNTMLLRELTLRARGDRGGDSWAVQTQPDERERALWIRNHVSLLSLPIETYVAELRGHINRLPDLDVQ